jgi:SAM-dependent methyltransferase
MSSNQINGYDVDPHVAEIYDQSENYTDDVELIRKLIGEGKQWYILEPFCGTGRILIPLASAGHIIVGLDQARGMLDYGHKKINQLSQIVQARITLAEVDVITGNWPQGFDLVILGGNCFYELATPDEQEKCIRSAATALKSGGYVYVDNDHMEGNLAESWQCLGRVRQALTGRCQDGTQIENLMETIWYDVHRRLVRFRRSTKVTIPDGQIVEKEYIQQKHPVSAVEIQMWLAQYGFVVERLLGDRRGNPYTVASERAIFWARKL